MGKKTIVSKAATKSPSLRTTIPEQVVKELGITAGDALDWTVEKRDGKKVATIRKLE
ncbi:MAG: AbrB family transcriptional regulator [archaeon]|nr:AbrB family transcriptional regulator [archaeon]